MISASLSNMMGNLGWGSGFRLPVANDENKALEQLLEQKQKYLLEISGTLETDTQHCQILDSHFERIKNAVNQSQKMISAKRNGIETEQNLKSLGERLQSRVKDDFTKALNNIKEYQERNLRMTDEVEARKEVVEDLINTVKFDQVAMEKYKKVTQDKENYIQFLKSLNHLDERSSQEFQLKFGKMGETLSNSRKALNDTSMNTQTMQQQFGRLCNQFRRVHLERSQAISFWESTLKSMKQRDEDIKDIAEEYTDIRTRVHYVEGQCERNRQMLEIEKQNALHLEYLIRNSDKNSGGVRLRLAESKDHTSSLKDEILNYNTIINTTSKHVKEIQTQIKKHDDELAMMQQKLEAAMEELEKARARHEATVMETMSEESRAREIEKMIDQEEQKTESILAEIEKQRRYMWQRANECSLLTTKLKECIGKIKGTKTMITCLKDRAKNDDIKVQKKRQQSYHLELDCLTIESRIQHLLANMPDTGLTGTTRHNVTELREKLMEVIKNKTFLSGQESHMKNVNLRIQRDINMVLQEHAALKEMIENDKNEAKRCGVENAKVVTDLQNVQVENRILQMTLRRLTMMMEQERDKMFTLEQERIMMEAAAKERRDEIDLHLGLLKVQQRNLKEEKSKAYSNILEMQNEIDRLKTRYEFIINALNSPGDEPGQSESSIILKHAQEREALKREGDLWDVKVKEAEKEIAALQNTLSVLVSSNMTFKDSLQPAAAETPEAKMLADMENEHKVLMVRKRKADKRLNEFQQRITERQSESNGAIHQKMYFEGILGEKKYELNNIHFEIANQKAKIERANRMSSRLIKELGLHVHEDRQAIEMDLKLRCAREKFEFALRTLEKTMFLHHEIRPMTLSFLVNTELESVVTRLKKKMLSTDGGMASPYQSGSATPTRFLTPLPSIQTEKPSRIKVQGKTATEQIQSTSVGGGAGTPPPLVPLSPSKQLAARFSTFQTTTSELSDDTPNSSFDATTIFKLDERVADSMSEMFLELADNEDMKSDLESSVDDGEKRLDPQGSTGGSEGAAESFDETSKSEGEGTEEEDAALKQINEEEEEISEDSRPTA